MKGAGCQSSLPVVRIRARVLVPMIVEPENLASCLGHPYQLRNGIRQGMELTFAGPQRRLGALALGDLFRCDVETDDLAGRIAQRMPIGNPGSFFGLISTLA